MRGVALVKDIPKFHIHVYKIPRAKRYNIPINRMDADGILYIYIGSVHVYTGT